MKADRNYLVSANKRELSSYHIYKMKETVQQDGDDIFSVC